MLEALIGLALIATIAVAAHEARSAARDRLADAERIGVIVASARSELIRLSAGAPPVPSTMFAAGGDGGDAAVDGRRWRLGEVAFESVATQAAHWTAAGPLMRAVVVAQWSASDGERRLLRFETQFLPRAAQ